MAEEDQRGPMNFRAIKIAARAWTLAFWVFCIALPLAAVFARLRAAPTLFDAETLAVARVTAGQAAASAGLAAVIGLPLGLWVGSRAGRTRLWAEGALALPFGVPAVCAGLVWVTLLGRSGVFGGRLDWLYSFKAVILAHVFFNVPWIALLVAQARAHVPEPQLEAARTLGAGRLRAFRVVTWPRVRAAFFSALAQSFVFCAMSFWPMLGRSTTYAKMRIATRLPGCLREGFAVSMRRGRCRRSSAA